MQMYTIATFRSEPEAERAKAILDAHGIANSLTARRLKRGAFIRLQVHEEDVRKATAILHEKDGINFTLPAKPKRVKRISLRSHYLNLFLVGAGFAWLIGLMVFIDEKKFVAASILAAFLLAGLLISSIKSLYLAGVSGLIVLFGLRGLALRPPPSPYYGIFVMLIFFSALACGLALYLSRIEDVDFPTASEGGEAVSTVLGFLLGGLLYKLVVFWGPL